MCKVINTVQSVDWLRRAVRRWRSRATTSASVRPGKDKGSTMAVGAASSSASVPAGHVVVRVEGGRFFVRLAHLSHPAFRELLRQAEEEYGFASTSGPLALPCSEERLRDVLRRVSSSEDRRSFPGAALRRGGDSRPLLPAMAMENLLS